MTAAFKTLLAKQIKKINSKQQKTTKTVVVLLFTQVYYYDLNLSSILNVVFHVGWNLPLLLPVQFPSSSCRLDHTLEYLRIPYGYIIFCFHTFIKLCKHFKNVRATPFLVLLHPPSYFTPFFRLLWIQFFLWKHQSVYYFHQLQIRLLSNNLRIRSKPVLPPVEDCSFSKHI